MSERRAAAIRLAISRHVPACGKRYPRELQSRATALAQELRREGWSWARIAEHLGSRMETVRRWCLRDDPPRGVSRMRAVEVVTDGGGAGGLAIVSPSGIRVEGATLADVIAVLRALG